MNYEDYRRMYNEALLLDDEFKTVVLPVEVLEGESEDDAFFRFLLEMEFIESKGDKWRITNVDKINSYDPNLLKILNAMIMSIVRSDMDELIDLGFVYMTADEEGNIVYELTEAGEAYIEGD